MILLFDVGNTRIKYAMLRAGVIVAGKSVATAEDGALDSLLEGIRDTPEAIYLASVGNEAITALLITSCSTNWGITPVSLGSTQQCAGVNNAYTDAITLGVDRWAAIIGAYHLVNGAALIVDCGTACTADLVDRQGQHLGGAITPGLRMLRDSLGLGTIGIGETSEFIKAQEWGRSTAECINSGVNSVLVAFIEKKAAQAATTVGDEVVVFLTGGDAPTLLESLKLEVRYEKELVFLGMAAMVTEKRGGML